MSPGARAATPGSLLEARLGPARVFCTAVAQGNLGDHVGDDPAAVARNRAALADRVGTDRWVWLRQVHGVAVHVASAPTGEPAPVADAAVTTARGLALAVVTADCAPLVLASDDAVAVVHAGHRGLLDGVVEAALASVRDSGAGRVRAFLGPCIRAPRYEFGAAALEPFVARFGAAVRAHTTSGTPALDIPAAIAVVLERAGVEAFDDCGICTASDGGYFSYRRDGATGRQATVALLP